MQDFILVMIDGPVEVDMYYVKTQQTLALNKSRDGDGTKKYIFALEREREQSER